MAPRLQTVLSLSVVSLLASGCATTNLSARPTTVLPACVTGVSAESAAAFHGRTDQFLPRAGADAPSEGALAFSGRTGQRPATRQEPAVREEPLAFYGRTGQPSELGPANVLPLAPAPRADSSAVCSGPERTSSSL